MSLTRSITLTGMGRTGCLPCSRKARCVVSCAERTRQERQQPSPLQQLTPSATLLGALLAFPASAADAIATKQDSGWLNPIVDGLDFVLGNIQSFYSGLGVPNSYGWSIVSLTLFVKIITLPFTKKQVESAMAMQNLKPRIDVIKERYGEDKDKVQKETARLYEQAEVNPLAGCAPSIVQLPIFFGLFRSLNNVALSGNLDSAGWLWIPSLAGECSSSVVARACDCTAMAITDQPVHPLQVQSVLQLEFKVRARRGCSRLSMGLHLSVGTKQHPTWCCQFYW